MIVYDIKQLRPLKLGVICYLPLRWWMAQWKASCEASITQPIRASWLGRGFPGKLTKNGIECTTDRKYMVGGIKAKK